MELQFLDMGIENFSKQDFRMGKFMGLGLFVWEREVYMGNFWD